jgi:predicted CXXCH cytochrome family protein
MRSQFTILLLLALGAVPLRAQNMLSIVNSKHDFRVSSGATIRSTSSQDACIFCHTPHNASPGSYLWNHKLSNTDFPAYTSSTMKAQVTPIEPQDSSKLCLSCHDGTIALGDTVNDGLIQFIQGSGYTLPQDSSSNIAGAQGFTDDHPFGFVPVLGSEIHIPPPSSPVHLDSAGKVQCTSCHDPHREYADPTVGKFLVASNEASAICLACHTTPGWQNSYHRQPPDPNEDVKYTSARGAHTGYVGVSRNACESCHRPHSAATGQRLLKFQEEYTCYQCHDGSVASQNIKSEFLTKTYRHPVDITPSSHDASENPSSPLHPLPETSSGAPRHAECVDCHNPHYSNGAAAQPPDVGGPLLGVSGQSVSNTFLPQSANEYEICFKCHADSANKPQFFDTGTVGIGYGRNPQRQFDVGNPDRFNARTEFQFSLSYHPVTRPADLSSGFGGDVPSLRPAPITPNGSPLPNRVLSASSYIYCTDCHNNDTGRNLGTFTGPEGPHGSNIPHLLERADALEPPTATPGAPAPGVTYSASEYALCDKCHDVEGSILQNQSFSQHRLHVRQQNAACSTCHDPHASQAPMLINFDRSIVAPSSSGRLSYQRTGFRSGTCYLTCHGHDHNPATYHF